MNRIIKILATFYFILICQISAQQINPDELMVQANSLYQQQLYNEAATLYERILENDFESSALYFNLGNAYYRQSKLGYAILNFERALKLDADNEDAAYNLSIAKAHTVDKIKEVPRLFILEWWSAIVTAMTVTGWSIIVTALFWVFLSILGIYLLSRKMAYSRMLFYAGSSTLAVLIIASLIFISRVNLETSSEYGVLVEEIITAKVSPDDQGNDSFVIHEGVKFTVEDELQGWAKIKLADGKIGWLPKKSFELI